MFGFGGLARPPKTKQNQGKCLKVWGASKGLARPLEAFGVF